MRDIGRRATAFVTASLCVAALGLGGCATTQHEFTMPEFASVTEPVYPSVDIFLTNSSEEFRTACSDFDRAYSQKHCAQNKVDLQLITDEFTATGHFESAELASRTHPYHIAITTAVYHAPSLFPPKTNSSIKVEGEVNWHSHRLHEFAFDLPFTLNSGRILFSFDFGEQGMARSVVAGVMNNLESSNALSAEHLHNTVKPSDYTNELLLPSKVGEFTRVSFEVLHDPFDGAGTRYEHKGLPEGQVDVFVYPIQQWQYGKHKYVTREVESVRRDIKRLEKQGNLTNLVLHDTQSAPLSGNDNRLKEWFTAEYQLADGTQMATQTHIFATGDKFVKIRATYGAFVPAIRDLPRFVGALAEQIVVPDESLFMARLRKQWRSYSKLRAYH